ncbi:MAG: prepilin-type N-terminal cleavage/methylation domain-containing protein [Candidatus Magnetoovum sp. WYHC-5]|nr:prepilin-type N-terminal cleavage/methylation domain-containing protein [Candidatus Magnetoovum sp. WYHC-5]
MKKHGFTIIELIIVIFIIAAALGLVLPFSINMYNRYKASLEAEKVLTIMLTAQREAFLHGKSKEMTSKDGTLYVNGVPEETITYPVTIKSPLMFFSNGTSSGGIVEVEVDGYGFEIVVEKPLGKISLEDTFYN